MMNLNSKYFDSIRIAPDAEESVEAEDATHTCEWEGCKRAGDYRAPKGRHREGQYHRFCLEHVRQYNRSYNYFAGMPDEDVAAWQKSAATGHRPTWSIRPDGHVHDPRFDWAAAFADPFGFFGRDEAAPAGERRARPLRNHERKSFAVLDLEGGETAEEIRTRYKALVKRLHPDANGGDRTFEDRLREIIHAYHYLKTAGFC